MKNGKEFKQLPILEGLKRPNNSKMFKMLVIMNKKLDTFIQ